MERNFRIRGRSLSAPQGDVRLRLAKAGLFAFAGLLIIRLFILQVIDANIYHALASEQHEFFRDLFPERGEILLQNKKTGALAPLATNKDLYLVYADPRLIKDVKDAADKLAPLLFDDAHNTECSAEHSVLCGDSTEQSVLLDRLSKKDDPYEPIKHGVEEGVVEEIKKLNIAGIDAVREPVRFYPDKNIGAHIAGFVGSDGEKIAGRYGIEGAFENELAGMPGFFEGEKDLGGRWIPVGRRELKPAVDGSDIILTIDSAIQHTACSRLNEAVARHSASGGMVIIMEVETGAILALCGAPDYDPNEYGEVKDIAVFNNPATFGQYEPGSVFKVITMAAALDTGAVTPITTYDDTGEIIIGPRVINNSDHKAHGIQTMTEVLEKSLNTGAIFAARKTGLEGLRDYVQRFGFGKTTGIGFQNEAHGDISALDEKREIYLATASFGQGIAVTPIQLLQAVGAIANQGKMMKPYIVQEIRKSNGASVITAPQIVREVILSRTATLLAGMMTSVVERGHGRRAGAQGYYVAGKTGTAQIPRPDGKGYEIGPSIGTFIGFAPVEKPKFVMLTRVDRPKDVQFAESSAAPLFGEIAKFLLQYMEIKPTRLVAGNPKSQ